MREILTDSDGRPCATYVAAARDGLPLADGVIALTGVGRRRIATLAGRAVGAVLVTDSGGTAPQGGPRIVEFFRTPGGSLRGTGSGLLAAAIAAARADGLRTPGLAVSDGNGARALYERFGFSWVTSAITVTLPDARPK